MMRTLKYIFQFAFFLVLVMGGIYFGSENTDAIRLVIVGRLTDPVPIWFAILIAFFAGAALSGVYFSGELIRMWLKNRHLKKNHSPNFTKSSGGFRFPDSGTGPSNPFSSSDPSKPKFSPFGSPPPPPGRSFGPPPLGSK